jgi:peptide/nickel transport system permease protein
VSEIVTAIPPGHLGGVRSDVAHGSRRLRSLLRRDRGLTLGVALLGLLVIAVLAPFAWRKDPLATDLLAALRPPSLAHPMGTDEVGRDMLARFDQGARYSLAVAGFVVVASVAAGGVLGLLAGTLGRWVDALIMRAMDALLAFPPLILAMAVTAGLGVGLRTAALGIALGNVPVYARLVRSNVVRIRALPMVEAAEALGAGRARIMFRHILPQASSTLLVTGAASFGYSVIALAGLGFVGLGATAPTPEWGATITAGLEYALNGQWWVCFFPGVGILIATVGANLIADRLQAHLDVRGVIGDR